MSGDEEATLPTPSRRSGASDPDCGALETRAHTCTVGSLLDRLGRPLRDLRISVTDRCNFRCTYCMPRQVFGRGFQFLARSEILTFEETARLARIFVACGVRKIRITGGEPLLRRDLEKLIAMLARIDGLGDLTLTTNGSLLKWKARALREAGLRRITVSLDSLDNDVFKAMNDVDFPVERVLEGIEAAVEAGLAPVKINMVVKKGVNDQNVVQMARYFRDKGQIARFVEYMDVGSTNGWKLDEVVSASDIVRAINAEMPLEPLDPEYRGEVAKRYRYEDGSGEIGVITSVTQPFCADCTRVRLSADGKLYTCLFATRGHDLRSLLREGRTDEEIAEFLQGVWKVRDDRYSQARSSETPNLPKVEMSYIGG
jgi:cyclic pyranopterin phosphate synthase